MTADDFGMARRWLETPEVQRWWGDPDGEISLLEEDLDDPRMTMWIVSHEDRPFAYIQDYDPHAWSLGYFGQPPGARFMDQFIGEPDMIGRGHGSAFIRQHVDSLLAADAPVVGVDPDPENARAVRAYEKSGFVAQGLTQDIAGETVLLMLRHAPKDSA